MNPHLCRVALRPRSPFEVFDLSLRLIRERAAPMAWLVVWLVLPAFLACWGLAWWLADSALWMAFLPLVLGPFIQAPFTLLGGRLLFQERVAASEALRAGTQVLGGLLITVAAEIVGWVLLCTGLGALLLPGLVFLPETALLERVDVARGLQRSMRLASGQIGVAMVAALSRWFLAIWGAVVAELAGQLLIGFVLQLGAPFGQLMEGTLTPFVIAGILLSHPLYAIFRLLLYVDVRTRMEGWDLQVGLRALGLSHGPRGAS